MLTVIEAIIRFKTSNNSEESILVLLFIPILVPMEISKYKENVSFYESLLPTLLYAGGANTILEAVSHLDPMKYSNTIHDKDLSLLFTSNRIPDGFLPVTSSGDKLPNVLLERVNKFYENNGRDVERTTKFLFRLQHVLCYHSESATYNSFLKTLKGVFSNDFDEIQEVYNLVSETISRHNGSYSQKSKMLFLCIYKEEDINCLLNFKWNH